MNKCFCSGQNKLFVVAVIFITAFIFVGNKALAADNLFSADANTISLWRFNDATSAIVVDEMGRNNGTAIGTSIVSGRFGTARYFDGVNDYVVVPDDASLNNLTQFTFEAWVNPQGFDLGTWANGESIVVKGSQDGWRNCTALMMVRNQNGPYGDANSFDKLFFNGIIYSVSSIISPWYTPNQWYYTALTYDGLMLNLYVNGELVSSTSSSGLIINNSDPLYINHHTWANGTQSSQRMQGLIDEVRISNIARSAQEIADNYNLANGVVSQPPTISALAQFKVDGATAIGEGVSMPQNAVALGATVNSSSTNQLQLNVEISTSSAFGGALTATSSLVASGTFATTTFQNLNDGTYYWRAKVVDASSGLESVWQEFGAAGVSDFTIKEPVLIIPGIMGSLPDLSGQLVIDPILHTYDNLYDNVAAMGYVPNITLFTLPYNWEKSNASTTDVLMSRISEIKTICNCQKINIIAHSMGGLVARSYIEGVNYQNDINYLILLGTPNNGAPSDYLAWEAGEFSPGFLSDFNDEFFEKMFWIYARASHYQNVFDYVRSKPVASVKELLPAYSYIFDANSGVGSTYPNNHPQNTFLGTFLNTDGNLNVLSQSGVKLINISGDNQKNNTVAGIRVVQDASRLPLWEDGYPQNYESYSGDHGLIMGNGDGTVPLSSANLLNSVSASSSIINSDHGDLPSKAISLISNFIAPGWSALYQPSLVSLIKRILIISIHSPAHIQVIDPMGRVVGDNSIGNASGGAIPLAYYSNGQNGYGEFVTIPNPIDGQYIIKTLGTGVGSYEIEANFIDDSTSTSAIFSGNTQVGLAEDLNFNFSSSSPAQAVIIPVDIVAPTTTISISGTHGNSNWYTSNVGVTLNATDTESGVWATYYSLDGAATSSGTLVSITTEGWHTLSYYSVDNVGNIEAPTTITIKIDKTAPEAKIYFDKIAKNLKIEGTDNISSTTVVMSSLTNGDSKENERGGNDDVKQRNSESSREVSADKKAVVYTISDEAGHVTTLKFGRIVNESHSIDVVLDSIKYDNGPTITIPRTTMSYEWALDKNKNFKELDQEIAVKNQFDVNAEYNQKQNKTQISVKEGKKKVQKLSVSGLAIIQLMTKAGDLGWGY